MQRITLLSTFLLAGLGVEASPFVPTVQRRAPAEIAGYNYAGCYTEATSMRALSGSSFFDDRMTIQKCATACSDFKYFGVEYGRECYCGNTLNEGSVEAPQATDCSFTCPGDASQQCGAGNRLSVYMKTQPTPGKSLSTEYVSRGCYAEPVAGGRALNAKELRAGDMTVQKCADFCSAAGYSLFGLEYYTECFCGNVIMPGGLKADESGCRFPCAGNQNEVCGGDWRLNLYEFQAATDSTPSSSSSTSAPSASATATPLTYTSEGCWTEPQGRRALTEVSFYDDALTVERCAAVCADYELFGVEYGRECYCGDKLDEGSELALDGECNMPCPGKVTETCGAGNRLNIYRNVSPDAPLPALPSTSSTSTTSSTPSSSSSSSSITSTSSSSSSTSTTTTSSTSSTLTASTTFSTTSTTTSVSTTSSTSTTSTTSSTTSTTSTAMTCAPTAATTWPDLLKAGNFETINDPLSKWEIKVPPVPGKYTYNLQDSTTAFSGCYSGSFTWGPNAPLTGTNMWMTHKITNYIPGMRYRIYFPARGSTDTGLSYNCGLLLEMVGPTGTVTYLGRPYGYRTYWSPVVTYWTAPPVLADYSFSVKAMCYGTGLAPASGITIYIDGWTFLPDPVA